MPEFNYKGHKFQARDRDQAKSIARDMKASIAETNPTADMSGGERALAGIGSSFVNVKNQIGNMLGMVDDEKLSEAQGLDKPLMDTTGGQVGRFIGDVAATAPLGAGAGAAVAKLLPKAMGVGRTIAALGTEGATEGAILAGPGNRGTGAAIGGAVGGALPMASKLYKGARGTPQAQSLLARGADLTPGQMNPGGIMSSLEQSSGRFVPQVGQARAQSAVDVVRSIVNESLPAGAAKIDDSLDVQGMINQGHRAFNEAYDTIKGYPIYKMDYDTGEDVWNMVAKSAAATKGVRQDVRRAEMQWLNNELSRFSGPTTVDVSEAMKIRSKIRARVRQKSKGSDPDYDTIRLLENAEQQVTTVMESQLPRAAMDSLKAIDGQYRRFQVPREISRKVGDQDVTPFKVSQAVRHATDPNEYVKGGGQFREVAKDMQSTHPTNIPPTGFAAFVPLAITGAGAATGGVLGSAAALAGSAALPGLMAGTRTGRKLYRGDTKIQKLLEKATKSDPTNAAARAALIAALTGEK